MGDNEHTRMDCDKGPLLEVLLNGQDAMFKKLDNITSILSSVAVQDIEIKHLSKRVADFEGNSIRRDDFLQLREKIKEMDDDIKDRLGKLQAASHEHKGGWFDQVKIGVLIAVLSAFVLGATTFGLYMVFSHYGDFDQNSKTQYEGNK